VSRKNIDYIAERKLLVSEKGKRVKSEVRVRISLPYVVLQENVQFPVDGVVSGCHVDIDGIDERGFEVYGMDSLQAINMASDIEPLIKRLGARYDFYWITGEPYFEE
jgi:hypothetical protein